MTKAGAIEVEPPCPEYEQACLEAVRNMLGRSSTLERDGIVVKSVELVHVDDDLRIVASITRRDLPLEIQWTLYDDTFHGALPPGQAENPEGVATGMWIWAMGG